MAKRNNLLVFILSIGVFGILNTEMGFIGILPSISEHFNVSISKAGWLVSFFAIAVAVSGPTIPLLFSGIDRKKTMLLVLGVFVLGNFVSVITTNFTILLIARIIPALFHPVYCALAFSVAASSVSKEDAPKAVAKIFIGVSAGMVIGVPIASFIANTISLQMALVFFGVVNALVFIATLIFVPSLPVTERISYGAQLSILKKTNVLLSIIAIIFLNSAIYGIYSYLAEYLKMVTNMPSNLISFVLFIYGGANIIGNIVAGKLLTKSPYRYIISFPFVLGAIYIIFFLFGQFSIPMAIITLVWGILAGIGGNINQYLLMSSAPEAPDFANGLFISSCNVGTTLGAVVGGLFIAEIGTPYVVLVGLLSSLLLGIATIFLRHSMFKPAR